MNYDDMVKRYSGYVRAACSRCHGKRLAILDEDLYRLVCLSGDDVALRTVERICRVFNIPTSHQPDVASWWDFVSMLQVLYGRMQLIRRGEFEVGARVKFTVPHFTSTHTVTGITHDFLLIVSRHERPVHPLWFMLPE